MSNSQMFTIRNNLDVILMRMQVRDLARAMGMTLSDQACIALAASSLANALGLEGTPAGHVTMDCLNDAGRVGIRVIYIKSNGIPFVDEDVSPGNGTLLGDSVFLGGGASSDLLTKTLDNTKWMVDELNMEKLPPDVLKITLVKWMTEG
ncbi:MAG: hypothetical protein JXA33_17110 [Anaerolineae bacterium]|nr:hypothetical protein [Anaerolineae bacterium]